MSNDKHDIQQAMVSLLPRLRRFAYGLTGSLDEADDLVQATYVRALSRLDQWQAGTRLDSWMYRIAQSIRFNQLQAEKTRGSRYETVDPDTRPGSDGSRVVEAQLTLDAVRDYIWRLPEEQRVVLLLITVEGLSYKEAAETLDLPIGTITSRLARARLALNNFVHAEPVEATHYRQTGSVPGSVQ
jgi:RNA polymerase sigma-70 factor (ECF subfamily)